MVDALDVCRIEEWILLIPKMSCVVLYNVYIYLSKVKVTSNWKI